MSEFYQDTIAADDVVNLDDFEEIKELFVDENGVIYYYIFYFIEFYGPIPDIQEREEEEFMSMEELNSFEEEDEDFKNCFYYYEISLHEE